MMANRIVNCLGRLAVAVTVVMTVFAQAPVVDAQGITLLPSPINISVAWEQEVGGHFVTSFQSQVADLPYHVTKYSDATPWQSLAVTETAPFIGTLIDQSPWGLMIADDNNPSPDMWTAELGFQGVPGNFGTPSNCTPGGELPTGPSFGLVLTDTSLGPKQVFVNLTQVTLRLLWLNFEKEGVTVQEDRGILPGQSVTGPEFVYWGMLKAFPDSDRGFQCWTANWDLRSWEPKSGVAMAIGSCRMVDGQPRSPFVLTMTGANFKLVRDGQATVYEGGPTSQTMWLAPGWYEWWATPWLGYGFGSTSYPHSSFLVEDCTPMPTPVVTPPPTPTPVVTPPAPQLYFAYLPAVMRP